MSWRLLPFPQTDIGGDQRFRLPILHSTRAPLGRAVAADHNSGFAAPPARLRERDEMVNGNGVVADEGTAATPFNA
jgi:hypothetical protein